MSNRLKELREARGLSLVALAAMVGTTGQEISHLELGKRKLTVAWMERLGGALDCHPWSLVSADPLPSKSESKWLALFRRLSVDQRALAIEDLLARIKRPSVSKSN